MVHQHITRDVDEKRFVKNEKEHISFVNKVKEASLEKMIAQYLRCAYSGAKFTIENGPRRFSFERNDNAKAHFGDDGSLDNIVFIVRGLNTPGQMSRLKFLRIFLYSPLLAPKCSPEVTEKYQREYDELAKQWCAQAHK
jgi:hypothetical protein